uniref:Uncharacterized protein n=2 Tax=Triticum urartu TaxID=4572 RepID=A0A8R7Q0I7_TRIUA
MFTCQGGLELTSPHLAPWCVGTYVFFAMCSVTVGGFTTLLYMGCRSLLDASACDIMNICSVYSFACRGCPTIQRRCC